MDVKWKDLRVTKRAAGELLINYTCFCDIPPEQLLTPENVWRHPRFGGKPTRFDGLDTYVAVVRLERSWKDQNLVLIPLLVDKEIGQIEGVLAFGALETLNLFWSPNVPMWLFRLYVAQHSLMTGTST